MTRERACAACDGTGRQPAWCEPCASYHGMDRRCAACTGTGRILESIPASDAIADAETLFSAARVHYDYVSGEFVLNVLNEDAMTARLWQAGLLGHYISYECADSARDAARAAFRAVPGLRELKGE